MSIEKLDNNQLVAEYQKVRKIFVFAVEGSSQESEFEILYDKLFKELNSRNIDLRKYKN